MNNLILFKNHRFIRFICVVAALSVIFSVSVSADIGPKPSVRITVRGLLGEECFATLLSDRPSTGPHSVWDGNEEYARHNGNESYKSRDIDYETWKKFVEYQDSDSYCFLQEAWLISETGELAWTYYPPDSFKLLLYFPESDLFVSSGIYERYAFDSYYTVILPEELLSSPSSEIHNAGEILTLKRSYNYTAEILSLFARIIGTIIIELLIALLFCFREKKELIWIMGINTVTQVILNILLNVVNYSLGSMMFTFAYVLFEIFVFIIEAAVYCFILKRVSEDPPTNGLCIGYAFTANLVSFIGGYIIAAAIPGIF